MSNLYRHADKALQKLYRTIERVFQRSASLASWDEVNVISQTREMYETIDRLVRAELQDIAKKAYEDAQKEILEEVPERAGRMRGIVPALLVAKVLSQYDGKTGYRYDREWERKKDRLAESVMAVVQNSAAQKVVNSNELREALARAERLMQGQVREMADTMTDEARDEAFEQAGIERVMWNTQKNSKVCATCAERDGMTYPLFAVPPKHHHCRCWLTAVIPGSN